VSPGESGANGNVGYALVALAAVLCLALLSPRLRRWVKHLWAAPVVLLIAAIETFVSPNWIHPEFHGIGDISVSLVTETLFWLAAALLLIQIIRLLLVERARRRGAAPPRIWVDVLGGAAVFFIVLHILYNVFNVPLSAILATSSVTGIFLGIGLQTFIRDFFAGLALNRDKDLRPGGWVQVRGPDGRVVLARILAIGWRTTELLRLDGLYQILNNSSLTENAVAFVRSSESRYQLIFTVRIDEGLAPARAKALLRAAALDSDITLAYVEPVIQAVEVTREMRIYEITLWLDGPARRDAARDEFHTRLAEHFGFAGLTGTGRPRAPIATYPNPAPPASARDSLDRVSLFEPLTSAERDAFALCARPLRLIAGQTVIEEGEPGDSLFLVADGLLWVSFEKIGEIGKRAARFRPGDVFGEMSFFTGAPRSATIRAATDALLYEFPKESFAEPLKNRPELARRMARLLVERQEERARNIERLTKKPPPRQPSRLDDLVRAITSFFGS